MFFCRRVGAWGNCVVTACSVLNQYWAFRPVSHKCSRVCRNTEPVARFMDMNHLRPLRPSSLGSRSTQQIASLETRPMDGPQGLAQYLRWKKKRPPGAPFLKCVLSGFFVTTERTDGPWEMRCRLVHFADLDHLFPNASPPRSNEPCVEFEQRCFCMGMGWRQGCCLRAHSRAKGLLWP